MQQGIELARMMHRIYDFYYSPDQEHRLLTLLREMEFCSTLPMERKGISQDSGIAIMRVTGHFEGSHEGFQRMEAKLTEAGFQVVSDRNEPSVTPRPDRQQRKQIVRAFKTHVKDQELLRELETRTLPERTLSRYQLLHVATSPVREVLNELAGVPADQQQYSSLDGLIGLVAAMSVRYGLNPSDIRKVCQFMRTFTVDELNTELIAGRTFLFVPTNQCPRLLDQEVSLAGLRVPFGGHGYPGLLLDVAAFVEVVRGRLRELDDECR